MMILKSAAVLVAIAAICSIDSIVDLAFRFLGV